MSSTKTSKILLTSILMAVTLCAVSALGSTVSSMANENAAPGLIESTAVANGDDQQSPPQPQPPMVMMMEEEEGKVEEDGDDDDQEEHLNIDEPFLWQMAAFAARQMSDKRSKFKLMTLTSADKFDDSTYRLQLTLKRIKIDEPMAKNDVMYCTVEVMDYQQKWSLDNFGCSLPAMVRTRERTNSIRSNSGNGKLDSIIMDSSSSSRQPLLSSVSLPSSTSSSMFMMMVPQSPSLLPIMQAFNYHPNEIVDKPQLPYLKPTMDNSIDLSVSSLFKRSSNSLPQLSPTTMAHHPQPGQAFMYPSNPFPYRPQSYSYQEYRPYYKFYY